MPEGTCNVLLTLSLTRKILINILGIELIFDYLIIISID